MNRNKNLICRFDVPSAFELLKDRILSICTFHELPSSTILRPKCLLHEICWVNSHSLGNEAFTHWCLFVGQFNLTWLSPVFICSALFHGPLLCCVRSIFLCSRLERGSASTNQLEKALCPLASESTLALFPPFVCLPPTYTQHEHESSPVFSFQQCFISVPQPTHQNTTTGRHELLPLASVSLVFSLSVASSSTQSFSLSISILFSLHGSNWWPHPTPTWLWLHQAAAAVKATEQSVGGGDN